MNDTVTFWHAELQLLALLGQACATAGQRGQHPERD